MTTRRLMGWVALAALLGAAAPVPASAQIGGFIKRKLKEKIAQTVSGPDTTAAPAAAAGTDEAQGGVANPVPRVKKRAPGTAGPTFNEYNPEITPELLDRLEKLLAAQQAARADVARRTARFLPKKAYDDCVSQLLMKSPESPALMAELRAAAQKSSPEERQRAMEEYGKHMQKVQEAKCGPNPIRAQDIRAAMQDSANKAVLAGAGFTPLQYATVLERLVPFCDAAASGGGAPKLPAGVYAPGEVSAMQPRCGKLAPALKKAASPWS